MYSATPSPVDSSLCGEGGRRRGGEGGERDEGTREGDKDGGNEEEKGKD